MTDPILHGFDNLDTAMDSIERADAYMAEAAVLLVQLEQNLHLIRDRRRSVATDMSPGGEQDA